MIIEGKLIAEYIEYFINSIVVDEVKVLYVDDNYILRFNEKDEKISPYRFWEKSNDELKKDFDFKKYLFNEDIVGSMFFFLSGYWEYKNENFRDDFGRFLGRDSFQNVYSILEKPIVDLVLKGWIKKNNLSYKSSFSYMITHDIDHLYYNRGVKLSIKRLIGDILKRKSCKLAYKNFMTLLKMENPHSVEKLFQINKKHGIKAYYYFMPCIEQDKRFLAGYDIERERSYLRNISDKIISHKSNVGIHYPTNHLKSGDLKEDVKKLKEVLKVSIDSGRAHFLMFDIKKSFKIYDESGIKIDTTCGYSDKIGFRFGTSYPFYPYNFETGKSYKVLEVPLAVMDGTLIGERYMNLSLAGAKEKVSEIIKEIYNVNGTFVFLWHNSSFFSSEWEKNEEVYEFALKKIKEVSEQPL